MSHFTVLVVGGDPEKQLAPYQENNMGDCPRQYMEFYDVEAEYLSKWENGYEKCFQNLATNEIVDSYSKELYKPIPQETVDQFKELSPYLIYEKLGELYPNGVRSEGLPGSIIYSYRDETGFEKVLIPFKEAYPNFHVDYLENQYGFSKDEETGKYGYWDNPNSKWDYYVLGGRWDGFFKLKANSLINKVFKDTNQAHKKDIDLEGMRQDRADQAANIFDYYSIAFKDREIPSWEDISKKYDQDDDGINAARAEYNNHPVIKKINQLNQEKIDLNDPNYILFFDEDYRDHFHNGDRESFIKYYYDNAISTFAVILNGKWYEKGKMGWWAEAQNEDDNWNLKFKELLDSIEEDTLLTVFDCHI